MSTEYNLKELWSKQTIKPPQIEDIVAKYQKLKTKKKTTLIVLNIIIAVTISLIIFIWFYFEPKFITTKIGLISIILGVIFYLYKYNQILPSLMKINDNTNEFLESLLAVKKRQKHLQTKMLGIYFICLSVGICLYLFEYTSMMPLIWSVLAYTFTLIWIGFNWFYLRPRMIKKENKRFDIIIEKVEKINSQYPQEK